MHCADKGKGHSFMILSQTSMIFNFNGFQRYKMLIKTILIFENGYCWDFSIGMMWEFVEIFGNYSVESNLKSGHTLHISHQCIRVLSFLPKASQHSGMLWARWIWSERITLLKIKTGHLYSYVKLNLKAGWFSCIFYLRPSSLVPGHF